MDSSTIAGALRRTNPKLADRIESCGREWIAVRCERCGHIETVPANCESRVCPECSERRGRRLFKLWWPFIKALNPKDLSLLTLTVKNVPELDKDAVRKLVHDFEKFRERKYVRSRIKGGIWTLEAKRGKDGLWNLHVHAIMEHSFFGNPRPDEAPRTIPERLRETKGITSREELLSYSGRDVGQIVLSAIWEEITGDPVVDLRRVSSGREALRYVLKYVMKPPVFKNPEDYVRFLHAFFSVPLIKPFGSWYNASHPESHLICPVCGSSDFDVIANSWRVNALLDPFSLSPLPRPP